MIVHDCEQLSEAWFALRRGVPTASSFDRIITPKTGKLAAAAETYIHELIGERLCLVPPAEKPPSGAMRHGVAYEAEARRWLEVELNADLRTVGFITTDDGRFGCSPDFLTDDDCGEIKCPQPATQVRWLLAGGLPLEHAAQVHGHLVVTGLAYCWFCAYCPGLSPLLIRVAADEFTEKLRAVLAEFDARYRAAYAQLTGGADSPRGCHPGPGCD